MSAASQDRAVERLYQLAVEAEGFAYSFDRGNHAKLFIQMRHEAAAIVASYLGSDHHVVKKLDALEIGSQRSALAMSFGGMSMTNEFIGLVRAAINLLGVTYGRPAPKPPICDPELWEHVEELVRIEAWDKIPGVVVTFVEDWYRKRAGIPTGKTGDPSYGRQLFLDVLGEQSSLVLGAQASEREGWRFLGMGLAQAVGNVYRHNVKQREDAEQVAWGAIGLGSLLIGEMRHTHPEHS